MFNQLIRATYRFILLTTMLVLQSCGGCGFSCDAQSDDPAPLSLGFSASTSNDIKKVVLEVDKITFRRSNADNVVIDTFTINDLGETDSETFTIDLLNYIGSSQLLIIEDLDFDIGTYTDVILTIINNDVNSSYVENSSDERKALNVAGTTLTVDGFTANNREQILTIKFDLSQSLLFRQNSDDYLLTTKGLRIVDNSTMASINGRIDSDLFDQASPCDEKADPEAGNRLYLYSGKSLNAGNLIDNYTSDSSAPVPANSISPFSTVLPFEISQNNEWQYTFGFLPAGDYTLVFTCNAVTDDPNEYDNFTVPLPSSQLYEISIDDSESSICDIAEDASCQ